MQSGAIPQSRPSGDFVSFTGGLNVVTPPVQIPPGFVRLSQNFEEDISGGYNTLTGYERFDGKLSPSQANYAVLPFVASGAVTIGTFIVGTTSGASAVVIDITDSEFILTNITGNFAHGETITAFGATINGPQILNGKSGKIGAQYIALASDYYRSFITAVPGNGSILGVWYFKGTVYAFRNQLSGVGMFKSTSSGWLQVNLGYVVPFTNANTAIADNTTLTQGGVSATIKRVVLESGSLASGVNTGRLIISAPTGGNYSAASATTSSGGSLTLGGIQTAITIPIQNGRFSFCNANFFGQVNQLRMYGCDGVNKAFEFDNSGGDVFVPIYTGLVSGDAPKFIAEHEKHLILAVRSSLMISAIGSPYDFTALHGAAEIAVGDTITGLKGQPGNSSTPALAVYCRNRTYVLYGSDATVNPWNLVAYNNEAGAIPYSVQKIGQTYVLDDRGVTSLSTTQNFGNFVEATISQNVKTWLATKRNRLTDTHVARDKQQYRMFFSDGSAAYWTINANKVSMMPMQLLNPITCSVSDETYGGGAELIFFGSDNGYVYQMERGTSFDGFNIDAFMNLTFNHSKMYRFLKKYMRTTFELSGTGYAEFSSAYDLSYGSPEYSQSDYTSNTISLVSAFWDQFQWDNFVWDGLPVNQLSMSTPGNGENISIKITSSGNYFTPIKFSGVFIEFIPLRQSR